MLLLRSLSFFQEETEVMISVGSVGCRCKFRPGRKSSTYQIITGLDVLRSVSYSLFKVCKEVCTRDLSVEVCCIEI
jgi:hypothetical protein